MSKTKADVSRHFAQHYNGQKNIFTPRVMAYGFRGDLEWELSKGELMGNDLFGVTVLKNTGLRKMESQYDLSKAFLTELEATQYTETL